MSAAPVPPASTLTVKEIEAATRSAQIDGTLAGTCAGFLGSVVSSRLFKQSKNIALVSGLMTGVVAGYMFTQASLGSHLAQSQLNSDTLRKSLAAEAAVLERSKQTWGAQEVEGGAPGLEEMHDKYATTKGDH